ncbi:MAG: alanine racemase [Actinomycetes bacterium]
MFSLHIKSASWRAHAKGLAEQIPTIVPVAKGNGYGFGLTMLGGEAQQLGCDTLAVGTLDEAPMVHEAFRGDVLVLTPWHPAIDPEPVDDDRLILTASSLEAVRALAGHGRRVVVELLTSMRRFGLDEEAIAAAVTDIGRLNLSGFALHLPIDDGEFSRVDEISTWVTSLRRHRLPTDTLWVSHVSDAELATLHRRHPQTVFRPRIGTALWLGARETYRARGTVLAAHLVRRGQRFGYRQRRASHEAHLLVIGGGTSHGVALSAPKSVNGALPRIKIIAEGGLEAGGRALSPFHVGGRRRWFAEPPHMQVSMVWLPLDVNPPVIGEAVDVDVRMTTATFDRVLLH